MGQQLYRPKQPQNPRSLPIPVERFVSWPFDLQDPHWYEMNSNWIDKALETQEKPASQPGLLYFVGKLLAYPIARAIASAACLARWSDSIISTIA